MKQYFLNRQVVISSYDENWPIFFEAEKERIFSILWKYDVVIEHVGSTAVSGLSAKPILDLMLGTKDLETAEICVEILKTIEYEYEYVPELEKNFPNRRFLHKGPNLPNKHVHLHMVQMGSDFWKKQLLFRDYLRKHKKAATEYQQLKNKLAEQYQTDVPGYTEAKTEFILKILEKAEKAE